MEPLFVGAASTEITPLRGISLAGYPHFDRWNTGAHDPLWCTCVYLRRGERELAFVTLDLLYFSKQYTLAVRRMVRERCGMAEDGILCCTSHTHSGPWAAGNPEMDAQCGKSGDRDPAYVASLLEKVCGTILAARAGAVEGSLAVANGLCGREKGVGGNRRSPDGLCDPRVGLLAVRAKTGQMLGLIATYALHPTFLHEDSSLVSADYPAYFRRDVLSACPGICFGFAQGCSGDQSSRYFRTGQSFDEAERVGSLMAAAALEALRTAVWQDAPELGVRSETVELRLQSYPPSAEVRKEVARFTAEYEALKAAGAPYLDVQNANLRMLGAEDRLGYALCLEENRPIPLRDEERPAEVQVFRLGENLLAGIPGEVFVEYGLKIKNALGAERTLVFELSNGCLPGYCINAETLAEGGYEAGNSMLDVGFGHVLADTAIRLGRSL